MKALQDKLLEKEEENYAAIVTLKEENTKLTRQIKSAKQSNPDTEKEVARLSVENEILKKQLEEAKASPMKP